MAGVTHPSCESLALTLLRTGTITVNETQPLLGGLDPFRPDQN